jgi:hypothetical protein
MAVSQKKNEGFGDSSQGPAQGRSLPTTWHQLIPTAIQRLTNSSHGGNEQIISPASIRRTLRAFMSASSANRSWVILKDVGLDVVHLKYSPFLSPVTSKPASQGRVETGHFEVLNSCLVF